jgi:glucose-1-phosphatase
MIKACLFDIGNVLVSFDYARTFPGLAPKMSRSLEEIKLHFSEVIEELETGRLSSDAFVATAMEFIGSGVSREEFLKAFTEIFEPIEPVWEVVEIVRETVPVHLFSNTSELHERHLFETFPRFSRFHGGFYSWRLGLMKPDAGIYENALRTLGLAAKEVAYVDDLPANIATARRLGFRSHQYDRNRHEDLVRFLEECGLLSRNGSRPNA